VIFLTLNDKNFPKREALSRNRYIGLVLSYPVLIGCVPHAQVVSPDFLLPWLWPLAVVLPWLCFFYLDYFASRALGGVWIFFAYDAVHAAWDEHWRCAALFSILVWMIGIAGIWISGKPHSLRDAMRLAHRSRCWKKVFAVIAFVYALLAVCMLF